MSEYVKLTTGPCQFCDWTPDKGPPPLYAHNPDDIRDGLLACPKCGMELLDQIMLEEEKESV